MTSEISIPRARLHAIEGRSKGAALTIEGPGSYTVGRGHESDLQIRDRGVSREHCLVEFDGEYFWLVDAGSVNGTFVNSERITRYMLYSGDRIRIGRSTMLFERLEQ